MTCLWHVRAATDQGAQFAPRIESHPLRQGRPVRLAEPFRPFVHPAGIRRGAVLNDVPVARQSSDRPRRAVRAANRIPPSPPKPETGPCVPLPAFCAPRQGFEGGAVLNRVPAARESRSRPRRAVRAANRIPPSPPRKAGAARRAVPAFCAPGRRFPMQKGKRAFLHESNAFRQALLSGQDATDRNPRRPWEPPCGSNVA